MIKHLDISTEKTKAQGSIPDSVWALMQKHGLKELNKPKRTPDHEKWGIVMAHDSETGEYKLIRFGDNNYTTAGSNPQTKIEKLRRQAFKNRHHKNIAKGKMYAAYWADKYRW